MKRESGYYWTKKSFSSEWVPALWYKELKVWNRIGFTIYYSDNDFKQIDERRITREAGLPPMLEDLKEDFISEIERLKNEL